MMIFYEVATESEKPEGKLVNWNGICNNCCSMVIHNAAHHNYTEQSMLTKPSSFTSPRDNSKLAIAMVVRRPKRRMVAVLLVLLSYLWQSKQKVGAVVLPDWIIRISQAVPVAGKLFPPAQGLVARYREATDFPLQNVAVMSPQKSVRKHAQKLTNCLLWGNWFRRCLQRRRPLKNIIVPFEPQYLEDPTNGTLFEKLLLEVLEERNVGTSAVFAEPGIGKSVAAVLAVLKAEVNQSHMTVLLRGEFSQNLRKFFRTTDAAVALKVARPFFTRMAQHGIRLTFIIDNAFDNGIENSKSAVMELTRFAFDSGHHLIIIAQTEEGADEIGDLNGARTRIAPQQNGKRAEDYRWGEDLASQYLNKTVLAESKNRNSTVADIREEWLNATRMRDRFGGWNPTIMSLYVRGYLQLGEEPPTRGRLLFLGFFLSLELCYFHVSCDTFMLFPVLCFTLLCGSWKLRCMD